LDAGALAARVIRRGAGRSLPEAGPAAALLRGSCENAAAIGRAKPGCRPEELPHKNLCSTSIVPHMTQRTQSAIIIAVVVILDRLTKLWIVAKVGAFAVIPVIPGFFNIVHGNPATSRCNFYQ